MLQKIKNIQQKNLELKKQIKENPKNQIKFLIDSAKFLTFQRVQKFKIRPKKLKQNSE
jgi:hypothetical protein